MLHRGNAPAPSTQTVVADRKSIAVLPFVNLTGHPDDAYLADGLQEEVLNALARIRDFRVISRSSVDEFRGAGRNVREISGRLGVGTLLEGSLRRDGVPRSRKWATGFLLSQRGVSPGRAQR